MLKRSQNQLSNSVLPEEGGSAAGLIQEAVHREKGFAGRQIRGRKGTGCRKAIAQTKGNEQRLAGRVPMRQPASLHYHDSVVWQVFPDSPEGNDPVRKR